MVELDIFWQEGHETGDGKLGIKVITQDGNVRYSVGMTGNGDYIGVQTVHPENTAPDGLKHLNPIKFYSNEDTTLHFLPMLVSQQDIIGEILESFQILQRRVKA